jgi:hypothetical protein
VLHDVDKAYFAPTREIESLSAELMGKEARVCGEIGGRLRGIWFEAL